MIGVAGGAGAQRLHPVRAHVRRVRHAAPLDQIATPIAYPNLPVRIVGFMPGISSARAARATRRSTTSR